MLRVSCVKTAVGARENHAVFPERFLGILGVLLQSRPYVVGTADISAGQHSVAVLVKTPKDVSSTALGDV
jgi:hypothetical protein